jgi:hypothetical protein
MTLSPAAQVLLKIGYVFLHIQDTEKVVKVGMQWVLPDEKDLLSVLLGSVNKAGRKRPLGHFLTALRARATINDDIDRLLTSYLDNRNSFVHNLQEVDGWTLRTAEGCKTANQFLSSLLTDSKDVRLIFLGLLHAWKVQSGIETTAEEDAQFEDLSKYEAPLIARKYGQDA